MSPPPFPPKRASHIQMETTRVEDKEFAACKAAIKIYLQQNKGHSHPQSIDYPGQYHRLRDLAGPGYCASVPVFHFYNWWLSLFFQMLEAMLMAGSLCFADLLLWPQPDRVLDPWH